MTSPIADRILAELAEDPKSEDDLVVCFPKAGRDVIRVKVAELKRGGKIVDREGVYRLAPGVTAAEAVERVAEERTELAVENTRRVAQAIGASARQHAPAAAVPAPVSVGRKVCPNCRQSRPIAAFVDASGGHRAKWCTTCRAAPAKANPPAEPPPAADPGPVDPAGSKVCAKCETLKPRSEFSKNATKPDGLQVHCKPCMNAANLDWAKRQTVERQERRAVEPPEPAGESATVLPFPEGGRAAEKTLDDIVRTHTGKEPPSVVLVRLTRVLVRDPETRTLSVFELSDAGLQALRAALEAAP
jgi:hypothetical protein